MSPVSIRPDLPHEIRGHTDLPDNGMEIIEPAMVGEEIIA